jgi:hypothetical protein
MRTPNREAWLTDLSHAMVKRVESVTATKMPDFKISVGFPSRGALSSRRRTIGQCWNKIVCQDGSYQLFISPLLGDVMEVAGTVAHELVHANIGTEVGHKQPFPKFVRALGLTGKPTATVVGPEFIAWSNPLLAKLGPYPHSGMIVNSKFVSQDGRMMKSQCPMCEYKVRITQKWIDADGYGFPECPMHKVPMTKTTK